jgi:hypothetical protein
MWSWPLTSQSHGNFLKEHKFVKNTHNVTQPISAKSAHNFGDKYASSSSIFPKVAALKKRQCAQSGRPDLCFYPHDLSKRQIPSELVDDLYFTWKKCGSVSANQPAPSVKRLQS